MIETIDRDALDGQKAHWERAYTEDRDLFGVASSRPAADAARLFHVEKKRDILELGAGEGRDVLFFAREGFNICAIDYSPSAIAAIRGKSESQGLVQSLSLILHDIRRELPFGDEALDACYSHMLFCMAFSMDELRFLFDEVWRILRPGGICVYTVRHKEDPHYGAGIHRGEDLYEMDGFIVHFFDRGKIDDLSGRFEVSSVTEFEEGDLPRRLFRVILRKL